MLEVKLHIVGTSPLLMHNIAGMKNQSGGAAKVIPTAEDEARASLYWTDDHKSLAIPSVALHAALIKAGAKYKLSGKSLTTTIVSAVHIGPEMIPLNTTKYDIYTSSVVIKKNRIFRARPRINTPWKFEASFWFDENWLPVEVVHKTIPQVIRTAGMMVGLLDWRPDKKGHYGKFRLGGMQLMPRSEQEVIPEPEILGFEEVA